MHYFCDILCTGTYDIQSVSGSAIAGGLELSCTFATGSQARSCVMTISGLRDDCNRITDENVTIARSNNLLTSSGQKTVFCLGVYTITEVFEVESDGTVTTVESIDPLPIEVTDLPPVTTTSSTTPGYCSFFCLYYIIKLSVLFQC